MGKYNLNFNSLNSESYAVFFSFTEEQRTLLSRLPETLARMEGALHFAHLLRNGGDGCGGEKLVGSYLRASLAEYVAIEEMAKVELQDTGFSLLKTDWPLPHILKILRNFQMHIGTTRVSEENMHVLYHGNTHILGKWVVTDIQTGRLLNLRAFKEVGKKDPLYSEDTAQNMLIWLNDAQRTFGFPDLIHKGVMDAFHQISAQTC